MNDTNLTPREFVLTSLKSLKNNWDDYFRRPMTEKDMVLITTELKHLEAWIKRLEGGS